MPVSVLHFAPHYGGGVGTVVRSLIDGQQGREFIHRLLALESINETTLHWAEQRRVACLQDAGRDLHALNQWLEQADIVHLHWWNHPLLMHWMVNATPPPFRCILWSHVNGMYAPQVFFKELFAYPDFFVFATAYSYQSPCIPDHAENVRVVQSRSRVRIAGEKPMKSGDRFNIGYIGTVDYAKMHPEFINLCLNARVNEAKFIVCGGPQEAILRQQVRALNVQGLFDIRGVVTDVDRVLSELDVFGYPLNPEHYGTGEQVLLEAMGAGAVPVVLDTGCEKYIIDHGENGIIASSLEEYSEALNYLRQNPDVLHRMSIRAVEKIRELMARQNEEAWDTLYLALLQRGKSRRKLILAQKLLEYPKGARLLIQSYGLTEMAGKLRDLLDQSKKLKVSDFPPGILSATRGSPYHYLRFFPSDPGLQLLCDRLDRVAKSTYGIKKRMKVYGAAKSLSAL